MVIIFSFFFYPLLSNLLGFVMLIWYWLAQRKWERNFLFFWQNCSFSVLWFSTSPTFVDLKFAGLIPGISSKKSTLTFLSVVFREINRLWKKCDANPAHLSKPNLNLEMLISLNSENVKNENIVLLREEKMKANSTQCSQAVTHPSTD